MRRTLTFIAALALVLLTALASFMPGTTQAASLTLSNNGSITGTLVATPQSTLPTMLLLQVGGRTISVQVTSSTQVLDNQGNPLALSALTDGDTLQVTGSQWDPYTVTTPLHSNGVNASVIRDLSRTGTTPPPPPPPPPPTYPFQVTGTLALEYNYVLCLQNASVTNNAITPNSWTSRPCPTGDFPVYLSGSTTFTDKNGAPITPTNFSIGDTLLVNGSISGGVWNNTNNEYDQGEFVAATVQDLSYPTTTPPPPPPPPTYPFQVTGVLAAEYNNVLCLQNAGVTNNAVTPNTWAYNPCPTGDLPVYVTVSTTFTDKNGATITLSALRIGDTLQANGNITNGQWNSTYNSQTPNIYIGGQFVAATVQDLSLPTATPPPPPPTYPFQVTGVLAAEYSNVLCLQSASVTNNAVTPNSWSYNPCPTGDLPVYVTVGTSFQDKNGATITLSALQIGNTLQASGNITNGQWNSTYNAQTPNIYIGGQFVASLVQDLSLPVNPPPPPPTYPFQVTGVLAAEYNNVLCLQSASVTSNVATPNTWATNPCPNGELPVYVTGSTTFENAWGNSVSVNALHINDRLRATGTLSNGQFTASDVKDLSNHSFLTLVGTILSCHFTGDSKYFIIRVQTGSVSGTLTVYIQGNTQFTNNHQARTQYSVLHRGQVVTLQGAYNSSQHHWTMTSKVIIH